jgi:HD superfamily phosphohydrolase
LIGSCDTLGTGGTFRDPLWRAVVPLTALEQDLLRCWWVRRLNFVAHAGAAVIATTQSYSRLEHSLGLLALVVHLTPMISWPEPQLCCTTSGICRSATASKVSPA